MATINTNVGAMVALRNLSSVNSALEMTQKNWSFEFGGACFDGDRRLIDTFTVAESLKNPGFR
jgi:hypothetical protein